MSNIIVNRAGFGALQNALGFGTPGKGGSSGGGSGGPSFGPESAFAWWDGGDPTTMNTIEGGTGVNPNPGDIVQRWEDKNQTIPLTRALGSNNTFSATGLGINFSVNRLADESASRFSRWNFLHNGTGAAIWLRASVANDTDRMILVDSNSLTTANTGIFIERNADSRIRVFVGRAVPGLAACDHVFTETLTVADGMTDIVVVFETNGIRLFKNAVESVDGLITYGNPPVNTNTLGFCIGIRLGSTQLWTTGVFEQFAAFDQALDQSQISSLLAF